MSRSECSGKSCGGARKGGAIGVGFTALLVSLSPVGTAVAAGISERAIQVAEVGSATATEAGSSSRQSAGMPSGRYKASALLGQKVKNQRGEAIGEITDMALSPADARVNYAVLSFGGVLGVGDRRFAVPLNAFTRDRDQWVLNVSEQQLESMPGFDDEHWPRRAEKWPGATTQQAMEGTGGHAGAVVKASGFLDREVTSADGKELGEIEDLAVDLPSGRIDYVVIEHGGLLGIGEKLVAVPATDLSQGEEDDKLVLRASAAALAKAPSFSDDSWPATASSVVPAASGQPRSASGARADAATERTFGELDRDADGYLSKSEAAKAPGLENRYDSLDRNHDGRLDKVEFAPFEVLRMPETSPGRPGPEPPSQGEGRPVVDPAGSADWKGPIEQQHAPPR